MNILVNRFIDYVKVDTTSDFNSQTVPTTKTQLEFAKALAKELEDIGLSNVNVDDKAYVMATLPSNIEKEVPTIGFIAHMDTSPDMSGKNVNPRIIENYDGNDIVLNKEKNIIMKPKDFKELLDHKGLDLIVTDGTTLLGADNKAGIAEIVTAMEYLINNPQIPHGNIKIGFTPDEEVGRGADYFNVEKFDADFAYTMDGGPVGELEYENFNAASAKISIQGLNVHPGTAKDKMINSLIIATELNALLPSAQRPEHTQSYEGFFLLNHIEGTVESTEMSYIIRDHDKEKFEKKKALIKAAVDYLNLKYNSTLGLELKDSYYNMKEKIEPHMHIIDLAKEAMLNLDIEPIIKPIRGGTDGARLSYMGLPCPNIFTGGLNYHGKFEYISVQGMQKAVDTILEIISLVSNK